MKEALMKGYVKVVDQDRREELRKLVQQMRKEGHAVVYSDTIVDGRVTSATAHHYRTCSKCRPEDINPKIK